jgi:hypothetical protein
MSSCRPPLSTSTRALFVVLLSVAALSACDEEADALFLENTTFAQLQGSYNRKGKLFMIVEQDASGKLRAQVDPIPLEDLRLSLQFFELYCSNLTVQGMRKWHTALNNLDPDGGSNPSPEEIETELSRLNADPEFLSTLPVGSETKTQEQRLEKVKVNCSESLSLHRRLLSESRRATKFRYVITGHAIPIFAEDDRHWFLGQIESIDEDNDVICAAAGLVKAGRCLSLFSYEPKRYQVLYGYVDEKRLVSLPSSGCLSNDKLKKFGISKEADETTPADFLVPSDNHKLLDLFATCAANPPGSFFGLGVLSIERVSH